MNTVWDLNKKQPLKREVKVWDGLEKKEVVLDCSFIPSAITIEMEEVVKPKIRKQNELFGKLQKIMNDLPEQVKKEDVPKELAEEVAVLEQDRNVLIQEIGEIRLRLTVKVLQLNDNEIDDEWLVNHLDEPTLRDVCVCVPDITYDIYANSEANAEQELKKNKLHRRKP